MSTILPQIFIARVRLLSCVSPLVKTEADTAHRYGLTVEDCRQKDVFVFFEALLRRPADNGFPERWWVLLKYLLKYTTSQRETYDGKTMLLEEHKKVLRRCIKYMGLILTITKGGRRDKS